MRYVLILIVGLATLAGCGQEKAATPVVTASATSPEPIANVRQVMLGIVVPASNAVFGVANAAPADDAAWEAVTASAIAVAEAGNLLLIKPRAVDDGEWKKQALALTAAGKHAAEVALTKDAEKMSAAGDELYTTCEGCHEKYLPKK